MDSKHPSGRFQRSAQHNPPNESVGSHSKQNSELTSSPQPFFLQRPSNAAELASRLIPTDVDLHTKKNTEEHSTNHYDISGLVLRRGQAFSFTVTFNRDFHPEEHHLYVRLAIGSRSMISKGTQLRLLVDGKATGNGWSAKTIPVEVKEDQPKKNRVSLQVTSPSDAIIGKYSLLLEVRSSKKDEQSSPYTAELTLFLFEVNLYFLFNPWQKDDACALPSPKEITEYVMNEHGQIYLGSSDKPQTTPWYFGQFERSALLTALTLLDRAQLPPQNRVDPSVILRLLSSKICSNPGTNGGIFPSAFEVGVSSPHSPPHTSSSSIFKQYLSSNGRSIQGGSGANWQHAAVLCSLARVLGIPCRIVTVYNAACRSDGTENNDVHWDTKQRPLRQLNSDIICASHVWNECWMRREDLSGEEQGWQVIDSTPVQMCDGIRRTGPCAVATLKTGQLGYRWDSPFIHSSIHGRKSHWTVYPDGNMELLDVEENIIGQKILTRSLNNEFEPEDITDHYKASDRSPKHQEQLADRLKNDVEVQLKVPESIRFGEEILLELNAKNKSDQNRTMAVVLTVCIAASTNQRWIACHDQPIENLTLEAGKDGRVQLKIQPEQYLRHGKEENLTVRYYIHAHIKGTNQTFTRDANLVFNREDILKPILDEDVVQIGKPVVLRIQIANTLSRSLSRGRLHIDGLGINQIIPVNQPLAPKESTIVRTELFPLRLGVGRLYVTFVSDSILSTIQIIPLEIVREAIEKKPEEKVATSAKEAPEKTAETKPTTDTVETKEKPATVESEPQEKTSPTSSPVKSGSPASEHEDDDVEELYLRKDRTGLHSNNGTSASSLPHGSTLSLDKDKISIDSLDISNDRRKQSIGNNHP